jgi:hypothetical protein
VDEFFARLAASLAISKKGKVTFGSGVAL